VWADAYLFYTLGYNPVLRYMSTTGLRNTHEHIRVQIGTLLAFATSP
jgi:hypothetical protein